jgi:hypothetical protein
MIWPKIFITGELPKETGNIADAALCAEALLTWGLVIAGNEPPEKFGITMALIAEKLGIDGTPESFMELSNKRWPKGQRIVD